MSAINKPNPFTPGYGLTPPYIAGREREQELLNSRLEAIAAGQSVGGMVMFGPRGMGKTVLLGWLRERCTERKIRYVAGNSASMLGSANVLARKLLTRRHWFNERGMNLGIKWFNFGVSAPAQGNGAEIFLAENLIARCRKKPMVVLLDEAHDPSDPDVLRLLINTAQQVAQEAPFLLVLAGTPRLTATLRNTRATFIERAESIGLGCLDGEAAAAALRIPLEKDGISIAEGALDQAVEDSQGYPFFVQQWGESLWNHAMKKGISDLAREDVDALIADIQTKRNDFYKARYEGMKKSPGLFAAADALMQALLTDKQNLDRVDVEDLIKSSVATTLPDDADIESAAAEVTNELTRQDFFWSPPGSDFVAPGIPSFITYIHSRSKK